MLFLQYYCSRAKNPLKISAKEFIFSRVTGLHPITLLKNEPLYGYFLQILHTSAEHIFWGTALGRGFHMKAPKNYLTGRFSVDVFKEERTIDIFPIRSKCIKPAVTFSNNYYTTWLLLNSFSTHRKLDCIFQTCSNYFLFYQNSQ